MGKGNKLKILPPGGIAIVTTPSMEYMAREVYNILSKRISKKRISFTKISYQIFSRREVLPIIEGNVRGKHVYLFSDFNGEDWMRDWAVAQLTISGVQDAQADWITNVIPTFLGQRQDRKDRSRVPITARTVIDSLTRQFDIVRHNITIDMHSEQLEAVFPRAPDHLPGHVIFGSWMAKKFKGNMDEVVVVGPDAGSVKRNERLAERVNALLAFLAKKRLGPGQVEMKAVYGDEVAGKICVINDDIIDTSNTIIKAADTLMNAGAREVYLTGTHAVFGGDAYNVLEQSGFHVVTTDTLLTKSTSWKTVLPVAPYLAEVILQNNIEHGSVSQIIDNGLPVTT